MRMGSGSSEVGGVSGAVVAAMPSPPSLSLPLEGGGHPRTTTSPGGEAVSLQGWTNLPGADLLATVPMFGTVRATSSPPPSRGMDREGGLRPLDRGFVPEVVAR